MVMIIFDIHYELESVQVDEINYAYIPDFDSKYDPAGRG